MRGRAPLKNVVVIQTTLSQSSSIGSSKTSAVFPDDVNVIRSESGKKSGIIARDDDEPAVACMAAAAAVKGEFTFRHAYIDMGVNGGVYSCLGKGY